MTLSDAVKMSWCGAESEPMRKHEARYYKSLNQTTSANGHTIRLVRGVYYVDGVAQPSGI
jgi:hypothetical protein